MVTHTSHTQTEVSGVIAAKNPPCVLVIDDDPRSLELMTIVLGKAGYRVVTASDGHAGLECIAMERPDVVLVDLLMPGIDGYEFCRRVRAGPGLADLPLVLFTAMASTEVQLQAGRAGANSVMMKPFDRAELLDCLARLQDGMRGGSRPGSDGNGSSD